MEVHTSEKLPTKGATIKTTLKKENNSFPTKLTLHSLMNFFLNYPACSIKLFNKLSFRLMIKASVALCSQKTDDSNSSARARARGPNRNKEVY